jgi:parvulin-like peptidyl-prolyl isomerase
MKAFLKDWRNIALVLAVIAIVVMAGIYFTEKSGTKPLVMVNNVPITEGQLITAMKEDFGNDTLGRLIDDKVWRAYAIKKGIEATADEVDQLINFQSYTLKRQNEDFDAWLKGSGRTLDEYRDQKVLDVLRIKIVVPEEDIKKAYLKAPSYYDLPPIYRIRLFIYRSQKDAKDGIAKLMKLEEGHSSDDGHNHADGGGANVQMAALTALNGQEATVPVTYNYSNEAITKALSTMKDGMVSMPVQLAPQSAGGAPVWAVIQLLERADGEKGTLENRRILIGQELLQNP